MDLLSGMIICMFELILPSFSDKNGKIVVDKTPNAVNPLVFDYHVSLSLSLSSLFNSVIPRFL